MNFEFVILCKKESGSFSFFGGGNMRILRLMKVGLGLLHFYY